MSDDPTRPSTRTEQAAEWVYRGVWGAVTDWMRVPERAPAIPSRAGEVVEEFHPAPGFLRWLKFYFWLVLILIDGVIFVVWAIIASQNIWLGLVLLGPTLFIAIVPDIIAYIAIHLRFDTTWYVMTERSLRIRRGIWVIHEVTLTFENVQNVKVTQGPLQRGFGIANVTVETAGSGGGNSEGGKSSVNNQGLIEGVADAQRIRDLVMSRVRASRSAGLGDERSADDAGKGGRGWSEAHVRVLEEIRAETAALRAG